MVLKFTGSSFFRQRLILSTLSGKSIVIRDIRIDSDKPGLTEAEASVLRLLEKVTNGCKIEIDYTGTTVYYKPGFIVGGKVDHDCGKERGVGYFLELLVCLAPFGKEPLRATLSGITNHSDNYDMTADLFRTVMLPNMRHFGITENLQFKIIRRGAPPEGGGMVYFQCPVVKSIKAMQLVDEGQIRRIRGVAFSTRISPSVGARVIDAAKGILSPHMSDVYIYGDHFKGKESGLSSGFGITLVAESTTGCLMSSEVVAQPQQLPEDVGKEGANRLLLEILRRGCVDSTCQSVLILMMALGPEDVSKIRIGKLTPYSIELLRGIKEFLGVTYKIEPDEASKTVLLSCLGSGFSNLSRIAM